MAFLGDPYDHELVHYGVTFCDEFEEGDRLIVAPGLRWNADGLSKIEIVGTAARTLDFLRVDGSVVGFGYLYFAGFLNYFCNAFVPDEFPIQHVSDVTLLALNDHETRIGYIQGDYEKTIEVYLAARDYIAPLEGIPASIIERMREYLADSYRPHIIH